MSATVDISIYPDGDTIPTGHVNPGNKGRPFGVLSPLGQLGDARIQFLSSIDPAAQAGYLRALASAATQVADQLDPPTGGVA